MPAKKSQPWFATFNLGCGFKVASRRLIEKVKGANSSAPMVRRVSPQTWRTFFWVTILPCNLALLNLAPKGGYECVALTDTSSQIPGGSLKS